MFLFHRFLDEEKEVSVAFSYRLELNIYLLYDSIYLFLIELVGTFTLSY